jgi:hypothetical protein
MSRWDDNVKQDICTMKIGQSMSRTVVNGEMSLRRLKLSIYEVVMPRE